MGQTVPAGGVALTAPPEVAGDTQNVFDELLAADKAKRKFFGHLTGWLSAGLSQAQIEQALAEQKAGTKGDASLAAIEAFNVADDPQYQIGKGMASLTNWATKENAALATKPSIHR